MKYIKPEFVARVIREVEGIDILKKTRKKQVVLRRHIAHYIARDLNKDASFEQIGRSISGKNHATVMHSCKTCKRWMETKTHSGKYLYHDERMKILMLKHTVLERHENYIKSLEMKELMRNFEQTKKRIDLVPDEKVVESLMTTMDKINEIIELKLRNE